MKKPEVYSCCKLKQNQWHPGTFISIFPVLSFGVTHAMTRTAALALPGVRRRRPIIVQELGTNKSSCLPSLRYRTVSLSIHFLLSFGSTDARHVAKAPKADQRSGVLVYK